MLAIVVQSDWNAAHVKSGNGLREEQYGSIAILQAAKRGLIDHLQALERISPCFYGQAAKMLNIDARREIALRINASIKQILGIESDYAFSEFNKTTVRTEFSNILDNLKLDEFSVIASENEDLVEGWYKLIVELPGSMVFYIYRIIIFLAHALSGKEPDKAKVLFKRVNRNKPFRRIIYSPTGVDFDAMTIWAGESNPVLDEQCFMRLDRAETDHDLSLEVLAGLMNRQQALLRRYVEEKLKCEVPAEIARGITVAGFSDMSEFNAEAFSRYENYAGLMGAAYKAAKYAYERNRWARHWFGQMCKAQQPNDFWQSAVLFKKIVDGRFEVWLNEYESTERLIAIYRPNNLENRYKRWEQHRRKTLFGNEAPEKIFLHEADIERLG